MCDDGITCYVTGWLWLRWCVFKSASVTSSLSITTSPAPCDTQSGLSRELFERWCSDKKNGLIIPGYVVEGTLAKHVLTEPSDVTSYDGRRLPLRMKVDYISFSAHVDYTQNAEFIDEMKPNNLVSRVHVSVTVLLTQII